MGSLRVRILYSVSTLLAMQTAIIARPILYVRLSVRHVLVFCPDEWRYDRAIFSNGRQSFYFLEG